jgi:diadenosine tetraphosphate (Ap4A) HIT family hydrolase
VKKYDSNNIFAKIIRGEIPCDKVYEDDKILAIHDIHPAAPTHILVLPKGEYSSFDDFVITANEIDVANFFRIVKKIANQIGLTDSGYRLIANHGADASQTIPHFHMHILGRKKLGPLIVGDSYHN